MIDKPVTVIDNGGAYSFVVSLSDNDIERIRVACNGKAMKYYICEISVKLETEIHVVRATNEEDARAIADKYCKDKNARIDEITAIGKILGSSDMVLVYTDPGG